MTTRKPRWGITPFRIALGAVVICAVLLALPFPNDVRGIGAVVLILIALSSLFIGVILAAVRGSNEEKYGTIAHPSGRKPNQAAIVQGEAAESEERLGIGSNCHICGQPRIDADPSYTFGLAKDVNYQLDWGSVLGLILGNLIGLLSGHFVVGEPGSRSKATIARCRLVFCAPCASKYTNWFGRMRISQELCAAHPSWDRLIAEGYSRYFSAEKLTRFK